jgi:hypothetical protein
MNGTWFLKDLRPLQAMLREVMPEAVFEFDTFPFPDLTEASTDLVRAGNVNQNSAMRAILLIPDQHYAPWRTEAGMLLCWYLTLPEVTRKVFDAATVYDIPAIVGVDPKPEALPLLTDSRYTFLPLLYFAGYDAEGIDRFWTLWQDYLANYDSEAALDRFLDALSATHRESLMRMARRFGDELDRDLLVQQLGYDPTEATE